jgi:hypothetical protein
MYDGGGGKGWKRGVDLMFKERDFFGSGLNNSNGSKTSGSDKPSRMNSAVEVTQVQPGRSSDEDIADFDRTDMANCFALEMLASMLLTFASVYVPSVSTDTLQQYVSSLARVAMIMSLKDMRLFPPDGTPLVSIVLLFSGAYTRGGVTVWADFLSRVIGQLLGAILIIFIMVDKNQNLFKLGILRYNVTSVDAVSVHVISEQALPGGFTFFTEAFGTFIECVATSCVFMQLMRIRVSGVKHRAYSSKLESIPPRDGDLAFAALCIGLVHYSIERVFRANVNPYANVAHVIASSLDEKFMIGFGGQIIGLTVASTYCFCFRPMPRVLEQSVP